LNDGWVSVHFDDPAMVLVPAAQQQPSIAREAYPFMRSWENVPVTAANASVVLEEAERALRNRPNNANFVWKYKARAL
jgi:hypothetical protein